MLQFLVHSASAVFIGVAIFGHVLVLRALLAQTDHVSPKRDERPVRGYFAGYQA